jgi:hypothetical protein
VTLSLNLQILSGLGLFLFGICLLVAGVLV